MINLTSKRLKIIFISVLSVVILVGCILAITLNSKYVYLVGTVTEYKFSGSLVGRGSITFSINNQSVDIGGVGVDSHVSDIEAGDKVIAKLIRSEDGTLTILDCPECYINKIL